MHKLSVLIKNRLSKHNLEASAKSAEVLYVANQLLLDALKQTDQTVKAYKFDRGILFIAVENPSLRQEVWGKQQSLLKDLQTRFGEKNVKKICLKSLTID